MPSRHQKVELTATATGFQLTGRLVHGNTTWLNILARKIKASKLTSVELDLTAVSAIDSVGAAMLKELVIRAKPLSKEIVLVNSPHFVETQLAHYAYKTKEQETEKKTHGILSAFDNRMTQLWISGGHMLILISETVYWSIIGLWNRKGHRAGAAQAQALAIGVGALPVILTVAFLIGVVLALQAAEQLRQFGANIYVADLVCISMAREMGPLMTAIILAGRSGAAIAAEISTMNVSEETDALVVMGIRPIRYIVVPKILGISLTIPLLSILATVVGILGGLVASIGALDVTPIAFLHEAKTALFLKDIVTGQIKSMAFAWLIVICAAYFGFKASGGPEGVGRATTSAVVASIFSVIVADALLGLMFYA